jgi:thiazole synthase
MEDPLIIAGKEFRSRLMVGTGRHRSMDEMVESIEASGAEIITVAIRRLDLDNLEEKSILDYFDWGRYTILPNTAGCKTVEEAVFTAHLAREVTGTDWLKLEVIPYPGQLLPDPVGTYEAAKQLIGEGFTVLPYIHADPVLARMLEEIGCATVMPLGSAIGSGQGVLTIDEVKIIIENASVPVVVDAGLGVPSEAARCLEIGADAVLVNTAIAQAGDPARMAEAFRLGAEAGRKAFLSGRIASRAAGAASSPMEGVPQATASRG